MQKKLISKHQVYNYYDIKCSDEYGENLTTLFPKSSLHLIYSQNAIDHSKRPDIFLANLVEVLKPQGFLVLNGYIKEGSNSGWLNYINGIISKRRGST
jgi:2-polyprenyl-3-methyl-5-hydroxy-6-metoxy-1,4-benzoquinol methylase